MGSAFKSYNYDLLSYISWFSYDVDPISGSYSNPDVIQELRDSGKELIQLAQEKDSKKNGVIAAATAKAKTTVSKLRDRVKEAVKRDKAEKPEKAENKSTVKDKIAATTDKAKETVGKLRDRVKEAVKRDKAEKPDKSEK